MGLHKYVISPKSILQRLRSLVCRNQVYIFNIPETTLLLIVSVTYQSGNSIFIQSKLLTIKSLRRKWKALKHWNIKYLHVEDKAYLDLLKMYGFVKTFVASLHVIFNQGWTSSNLRVFFVNNDLFYRYQNNSYFSKGKFIDIHVSFLCFLQKTMKQSTYASFTYTKSFIHDWIPYSKRILTLGAISRLQYNSSAY